MKKFFSVFLVLALLIGFSVVPNQVNAKNPHITLNSFDAHGFSYDDSGEKLSDVTISFSKSGFKNGKLNNVIGVLKTKNDSWKINGDSLEFEKGTYTGTVTYTNSGGVSKEGALTVTANKKVVSGFIEDQKNAIYYTAGKESISPEKLKSKFKEKNIRKFTEKDNDTSVSIMSSDPNVRDTISNSYVYANMVGAYSLSSYENYSKYTVHAFLKNSYSDPNLAVRYLYAYVNPTDYSSGGGLSVTEVYPDGGDGSSIGISVNYAWVGASMSYTASPAGDANFTAQSYVRNYSSGFPQSDYYYDGYSGEGGLGGNFYTLMMGNSTSGSCYGSSWSVNFKIYDYYNHSYFSRSGSGSYCVVTE